MSDYALLAIMAAQGALSVATLLLLVRVANAPAPPVPVVQLPEGETIDLGPLEGRLSSLERQLRGYGEIMAAQPLPQPCRFEAAELDMLVGGHVDRLLDLFAQPEDGEPSEERALRHAHRFGPKDADGVRLCRCGDRYLDGMVV